MKQVNPRLSKYVSIITSFLATLALTTLAINVEAATTNTSPTLQLSVKPPTVSLQPSLSPNIISSVPLSATAKPQITSVSTTCVEEGKQLEVRGTNFGTSPGKSITLIANQSRLDLQPVSWNNSTIVVLAKNTSKLQPGTTYSIGIRKLNQSNWLSNLYGGMHLCKSATLSSTPIAVKSTTLTSNSTNTTTSPPTVVRSNTQRSAVAKPQSSNTPQADQSTATQQTGQSGGSLADLALPQPPQLPDSQTVVKNNEVEPSEVLVISSNMQDAEVLRRSVSGAGMRIIRRRKLPGIGLVLSVIRLPEGMNVSDGLKQLRQQFKSTWFDSNRRYHLEGGFGTTDSKHYSFHLIKWHSSTQCGRQARIGMIDSALDIQNPALKQQHILQKSFLPSGVKPSPLTHGTAIAALLVGYDPKHSINGLIPGAELFSAGVFRKNSNDSVDTTTELIVRGLDWLVTQHADVINFSLGGKRNLILEAVIQKILHRNIVLVAAAGNGGPDAAPVYPAAQPGVISVTAVDASKHIYSHANQGDYITVAAPGVDIWSASPGGNGHYYSGTSFAAPFVTAYFALRGAHSPADMKQQLQKHAIDLGDHGHDKVFGWGLLQAKAICSKAH